MILFFFGINFYFSFRYVDIGVLHRCHTTGLCVCAKIAKFTRKMFDMLFDWSGNRLLVDGLHATQRDQLHSTIFLLFIGIHHAIRVPFGFLLAECTEL